MQAECDGRDRRSSVRRVKVAGIPRDKWLGDFDFDANPNINPATGKSHLLVALGTAAAEKGFRVKYTLATRLVNELVESADEKNLARTIAATGGSTC